MSTSFLSALVSYEIVQFLLAGCQVDVMLDPARWVDEFSFCSKGAGEEEEVTSGSAASQQTQPRLA